MIIKFYYKGKTYKRFLNKLKTLLSYMATVGIHKEQGQKQVVRRYQKKTSKGTSVNRISGKSHRMTIAKLAYQNEFGARIRIPVRYKTEYRKNKQVMNYRTYRFTRTYYTASRVPKSRRQQGYLLLSREGKFVMYKAPNDIINIPARPFIKKTVTTPSTKLLTEIPRILQNTFTKGRGYNAKQCITQIAKAVEEEMKQNCKNTIPNHKLTVKAKGFNSPLFDIQDRLYKSIKYKIYKNTKLAGSKGNLAINKQVQKHIDEVLKTIDELNKGLLQGTVKEYYKDSGYKFYKDTNPIFKMGNREYNKLENYNYLADKYSTLESQFD